MRDLRPNIAFADAIFPRTISSTGSPDQIVGTTVDLQFFESAEVVVYLGDIDELGSSPVGSSKVEMLLEDSEDDSTYSAVALADTLGPSSVTSGIVASSTGDQGAFLQVGYVGGKRYLRITLLPTTLTNGGPITAFVIKGHPRHAPQ